MNTYINIYKNDGVGVEASSSFPLYFFLSYSVVKNLDMSIHSDTVTQYLKWFQYLFLQPLLNSTSCTFKLSSLLQPVLSLTHTLFSKAVSNKSAIFNVLCYKPRKVPSGRHVLAFC